RYPRGAHVDCTRRRRGGADDAHAREPRPALAARARSPGLHQRRARRMTSTSLRATLHRRLLAAPFDPSSLGRQELRAHLAVMLRDEAPLLAAATADMVLDELVDDVGGLGPLEPLVADPAVTEIMVNGPDRVYVERDGRIERVPCIVDAPTIVRLVERVIAPLGLRLDRASPMV